LKTLSYGKQQISAGDIREVARVLRSDWITQGSKVREFEDAIAAYCGAKYSVAVSSGTAALHLACLVAGLGPGDEAVTSPVTFLATANAVVYAGATPVFADVDYETANIDPEKLPRAITHRTKAVLPVHLAGLPCDMEPIARLSRAKGLTVIEDACHALGAEYRGEKIGSCRYSDMTVFSFHPVKPITTGEGGCITTNSARHYKKLMSLRSHGVYRSPGLQRRHGGWFSEMRELGFNYRITDFQCALGLSQLAKLDHFLAKREAVARRYNRAFQDLGPRVKLPALLYPDRRHGWHLYLFRLRPSRQRRPGQAASRGLTRRKLYDALRRDGIQAQVHYVPVYKNPFYRHLLGNDARAHAPNAESYYEETLSLPIFPSLGETDITRVIRAVHRIFKEEGR
jgi:UDP-4-amino-4,6-dideoxy-N-acetyl-beta-L-altrosamine transaminase